jgi:hypothetical protein
MTQEEILAMPPGTELNLKVAETIMGHRVINDEIFGYMERASDAKDNSSVWSILENYSQELSIAESIVGKMVEMGFEDAIYWADFGGGKYTEPEAICKAALVSSLGDSKVEQTSEKIIRQALGD